MINEAWTQAFVATAAASGAVVVVGALITGGKRGWSDWIMAAGAAVATAGLGMTCLVAFDLSEWLLRHGEYPCLGSICLGAMIFGMGFVMDQIRYRAVVSYEEQLKLMEGAGGSPPVERPVHHE